MNHLLPGCFVLAFKHVLKLLKGGSPVEMDFLGPIVEIRDGLVYDELDTKFSTVNVDFSFHFEASVFVLHFVGFFKEILLVPGLVEKGGRWFFVDQCHLNFLKQYSVRKFEMVDFCFPEEDDVCYLLLSKV